MTPRRGFFLALIAFALVVLFGPELARGASPWPWAVESPALEQRLPTATTVYCEPFDNSWNAQDEGAIYVAGWACDLLLRGRPGDTDAQRQLSWAFAAHTLYHEWWHHAFDEHDEQATDVGALVILRYALRTWWGLTPAQAQAQYALVGGCGGYACTHYRPAFTPNGTDPVLRAYR